jgi:extracellular factor (EF) 3-hydroxypalmitic acid methyl ester biosynthesis protein
MLNFLAMPSALVISNFIPANYSATSLTNNCLLMESLNNINQQFEELINEKKYLDPKEFDNFLNTFKAEIERHEKLYSRDEIVKNLEKLRSTCAASPFVLRTQQWPRGYQGDFEMIDHIMKARNLSKEGTFAYYYEDYFLNSDICKQHANKVAQQARLIQETIAAKNDAKIISIGCGTSADIESCISDIECSDCQITLIDVDNEAINFSLKHLERIKDKIAPLHGNIYKVMRNLSEKYDLNLIGGVFDYLNDKIIVSILKSLRDNIVEDGKIFFTNIDKNNPYRVFMEYTGDWFLIERSEAELSELIASADWPKDSYKIARDQTRLTHLVELNYITTELTAFAEAERSWILLPSF